MMEIDKQLIQDISDHLFAIGQLIEVEEGFEEQVQGKKAARDSRGGSHRARAYKNVARTLITTNVDLDGKIPGAGTKIGKDISEFRETGTSERLKQLTARFPKGILDLTKVQGIGPKKARQLWEAGMRTLEDLRNNIESLKDQKLITPRIEEALRETMDKKVGERMPRAKTEELVGPALLTLQNHPLIEEVVVAGSVRRKKDTCKDADIVVLVSEENHEKFWNIEEFRKLSKGIANSRVVNFGSQRAALYVEDEERGMNIDIWRALPWNFGGLVLYTTGSKGFNIWMRQQALEQGYTLNDWGLFPEWTKENKEYTKENQVSVKTEKEIFEFLKLDWVEPSDREKATE